LRSGSVRGYECEAVAGAGTQQGIWPRIKQWLAVWMSKVSNMSASAPGGPAGYRAEEPELG